MNPQQKKALKARAHSLDPVVIVGDKGVTATLIAEVDRALAAHELIKVRAPALDRDGREAALAEIALRCGAEPVQAIGKVFVLYRQRPPEDGKTKPEAAATPKRPSRRRPAAARR